MDVILFNRCDIRSRYIRRARKVGAETRLMSTYVSGIRKVLEGSGKNFAVFVEPMLPTGYPDCVVVEYDAKAYDHCKKCPKQSELNRKVRFVVMKHGGIRADELSSLLGYAEDSVVESLKAMREVGLVRLHRGRWYAVKRRDGIKKITTIEGKLTGWKKAVEQAVIDSTFANESYILIPKATNRAIEYAKRSGVGVYAKPKRKLFSLMVPALSAEAVSHIGLYFDEWICNRLHSIRDLQRGKNASV